MEGEQERLVLRLRLRKWNSGLVFTEGRERKRPEAGLWRGVH